MTEALKTQAAIVTGGAQRVGRVVCKALAKKGYRVAIHANSSVDEAEALAGEINATGGEAFALSANLTDETAARGVVDEACERLGRLDLLVNSAAIWKPKSFEEVSAEDVRRYFDVNAVATFVVSQHAGMKMCGQASGGAIINFGDVAMHHPQAGYAAYHPSKGAIPTMTRSLAVELAERNGRVRVNAILPGPVLVADDEPEERVEEVRSGVLLDTLGHADHLARAVLFLAGNEFVTGVCLPVDGGRSIRGV